MAICLVIFNGSIAGQDDAEDSTDGDSERVYHEEIIVTAEKIAENILDVPMTISAFDSDALEELVLQDKTDLQSLVAGLQFGDEMDQEGQSTVIRGIGTRIAGQSHADRAVANYVDGAYTLGVYGMLPGGGFDLDRIEVARGPQGTLNGRNSIAGSVNWIYKKPSREGDAELMTEITSISQQRVNLAVGGPIGSNFSYRFTGGTHVGAGRQENIGLGGDYDKPDHLYLAPQLRFTTDRLDMNLRYAYVSDTGTPRSLVTLNNLDRTNEFVTLGPSGGQFAAPPPGSEPITNDLYLYATPNPAIKETCPIGMPGFRCGTIKNKVALNFSGYQDSRADLITFYADYDLSESFTVRYSFSDNQADMINVKDADYSNRVSSTVDHTLASDGLVGPFEDTHYRLPYIYDERSHEIQITSNFDGNFNFMAGVFAYENDTFWDLVRVDLTRDFRFGTADEQARAASPIWGFQPVSSCQDVLTDVVEAFGIGTADPAQADDWEGLYWYCPEGDELIETVRFYTGAQSDTRAAFVSGSLVLDDTWSVSGGLRHTADEKVQPPELGGGFAVFTLGGAPLGVYFPGGGAGVEPQTWDKTIGHVSLEYSTANDNMVYGRVSTGYRAGGFNTPIPGIDLPQVGEETLMNYEIGAKGLFLDDRLLFVTGLWYNDFDGFQLAGEQPPPPGLQLPSWSTTPLSEYTSNIDGTTIWGADFEFSYWFSETWRVSGFYAYQDSELGPHESVIWGNPDAEYGTWEYIDFDTGEPATSSYPLATDMTGHKLPMQPRHKMAVVLGNERSLGDRGTLHIQGTYAFTGEQHPNIGNVEEYIIPSYSRIDANVMWTSLDEEWAVSFYMQNILNEIGLVEYLPISGLGSNPSLGYPTHPREFGMQIRWRPYR